MRAVMYFSERTEASEVRESGPLLIGTRVNQFEIRSVLGEGGTAVVYEAVHTKLNAPVALKVVNMQGPHASNAAARLRREAELCAAVEDPHVPKVYDVGVLPDGTPYLVMEKVVGPTLESLLLRGRLGLRLGSLVLRDLLRAVEAVQRAGVVHRDIKPANIIVQFASDRTPSVRLMDFGVSRSLFFRKGTSAALTRRGTILGTPEYMAPEQIQDQLTDVRTDVYALGVVGYEMFAGRAPFDGEQPAEIVTAVLRREHKPLSTHRPELPHELEDIITRAMEVAPTKRFAHAQAMRQELEARVPRALWVSTSPSMGVATPQPAISLNRERGTRWGTRLVIGTSLALALGVGGIVLTQPRQRADEVPYQAPAPVSEPAPPAPSMSEPTSVLSPASTALGSSESARGETSTTRTSHRRRSERAPIHIKTVPAELPAAELPEAVTPDEVASSQDVRPEPGELTEVVLKSPFTVDPLPAKTALPANPFAE